MYTAMKEPGLFKRMMFACGANMPEVKAYKETATSSAKLRDGDFARQVKEKYLADCFSVNRMNNEVCYMEVDGHVYTFSRKELDTLLIKSR